MICSKLIYKMGICWYNHCLSFSWHIAITSFFLWSGYRVYYVDGNYPGSSRMVLDHKTFILNLTLANNRPSKPDPSPSWTLLYRASEAYNLSTLFPSDMDGLTKVMVNDDRVFQRFWYLFHKGHVSKPCTDTCKTSLICLLRSGRYDLLKQCAVPHGDTHSFRKTMC